MRGLLAGVEAPWYVAGGWAIDLFLADEPREHEDLELAVPNSRPEIVLLFKAKHSHRERDQRDFEAVVPRLEPERRRWLTEALELVHPGHPWLVELRETRLKKSR